MEDLPDELLERICLLLDFDDMERLGATCHALRHPDERYFQVAVLQWGRPFWRDALCRPTWRRFVSMRDEMRQIHLLQRCCDAWSMPRWNESVVRALWKVEANHVLPWDP